MKTVKINTVSLTNPDFIYMLTADPSESEADLDIDEEIKKFESNAEFERTHENLRGCQYFKKLAALLRELKTLKAEQCEDAISREEMLKYQYYLHGKMSNEENHKLWQFIKSLPSVTPKQKTGKWNVLGYDDPIVRLYKCSECHMKITLKFNYCPNCGAKMEGGKK
jgi:hypothetical protein